jgi:S1-C subfamily serine protease
MSDQPASSVLLALSTGFASLIGDVAPSLISIQSARAGSTGFSWRPGLIVAAENALPDDGELSIVAHDGASSPAQIVGRDPSTDVALLRIGRTDLPKAPSAAAAPTAGALAFVAGAREGAANAVLGMAVFGPRRRTLVIPMTTVDRVADVLATKGRIARGYLGLGLQPVKLDEGGTGAMAISVDAKGPGAAAGVRQGDIIVAWNGEPVRGVHQLVRALGPESIGASVRLTLRRGGEPIETSLTIGERPESQ